MEIAYFVIDIQKFITPLKVIFFNKIWCSLHWFTEAQ